jgi:bifunctional DNA-binding transcriptional regulator/antitoxin component of YhaV-PrlF toxin-antitoxin module
VLEVHEGGQITLPREAVEALHLRNGAQLEWEIVEGGVLLRPVVPPEDAWAYTPEHRADIARAEENGRLGYVYSGIGEEFLAQLGRRADEARAAGHQWTREDVLAYLEAAVASGEIERAVDD